MLTEDQIKEFQQIYKNQFGKEISSEEALRQGTKLITLMKILVEQNIKNLDKSPNEDLEDNLQEPNIPKKSNKDNPKIGRDFEFSVRLALEKLYKIIFFEKSINIGNPPKLHKFDAVSEDGSIVAECKSYTWTESGNIPSAKMAILNEAVLYLSNIPKGVKKIIVLKKDYCSKRKISLAKYYFKTHNHLLQNISILELDLENMALNLIKG